MSCLDLGMFLLGGLPERIIILPVLPDLNLPGVDPPPLKGTPRIS